MPLRRPSKKQIGITAWRCGRLKAYIVQTALIALRGLLEAKEMHIQKLEVGIEMLT